MIPTQKQLEDAADKAVDDFVDMYLDWVNNFLTIEVFAEHYDITIEKANRVINIGRKVHEGRTTMGTMQ